MPATFFCEKCRLERADPFWEAVPQGWLLPPTRLRTQRPFTMAASPLPQVGCAEPCAEP